jgi:hypothetical protein
MDAGFFIFPTPYRALALGRAQVNVFDRALALLLYGIPIWLKPHPSWWESSVLHIQCELDTLWMIQGTNTLWLGY